MTRAAAVAILALATPAAAEPWDCRMTVRCIDTACMGVEETHTLIAADHEGRLFLTMPEGDFPMTRLSPQGAAPAVYAGAFTAAVDGPAGGLLTITADGAAILTLHAGPHAARESSFHGFCTAM